MSIQLPEYFLYVGIVIDQTVRRDSPTSACCLKCFSFCGTNGSLSGFWNIVTGYFDFRPYALYAMHTQMCLYMPYMLYSCGWIIPDICVLYCSRNCVRNSHLIGSSFTCEWFVITIKHQLDRSSVVLSFLLNTLLYFILLLKLNAISPDD